MPGRFVLGLVAITACATAAIPALAIPRVWIADQGDNHGNNNRIIEIHPTSHDNPFEDSDAHMINLLPSPAGAFLDELTLDNNDRLWCVVKEENDQHPDGARRINKDTGAIDNPPGLITINFPGEVNGGYLEGLAFDGVGLWTSAVRAGLTGNMLTRVDPMTGNQIAPFDGGTAFVNIPGTIAQGLLYDPAGTGYLWHSDVGQKKIYKLDIASNFSVVKTFDLSRVGDVNGIPPKGMDFMVNKIWVACPYKGIWEIDPNAPNGSDGNAVRKFQTPGWNLDGIAILEQPSGPEIDLSTDTIQTSVWINQGNPDDETFTIGNKGIDTLNYQIDDDADWLTALPAKGSVTTGTDVITVSFTVDGFPADIYTATITVTGNAINAPQTIAVRVEVETASPDFDRDTDVDMDDFGVLQRCFGSSDTVPGCAQANIDGNPGVGQGDFQIFQACLSGPNVPAVPGCDGG